MAQVTGLLVGHAPVLTVMGTLTAWPVCALVMLVLLPCFENGIGACMYGFLKRHQVSGLLRDLPALGLHLNRCAAFPEALHRACGQHVQHTPRCHGAPCFGVQLMSLSVILPEDYSGGGSKVHMLLGCMLLICLGITSFGSAFGDALCAGFRGGWCCAMSSCLHCLARQQLPTPLLAERFVRWMDWCLRSPGCTYVHCCPPHSLVCWSHPLFRQFHVLYSNTPVLWVARCWVMV